MIERVKMLGCSFISRTTGHLHWIDRKAEATRRAALKDHSTLEACLAGCVFLLLSAKSAEQIAVLGKPICALALIVVAPNLFQLLLIACQLRQEPWDE
jgi:hypothetical protein